MTYGDEKASFKGKIKKYFGFSVIKTTMLKMSVAITLRVLMKKCLFFFLYFFYAFMTHANPLPAAEVFPVSVKIVDPNNFVIQWQIKDHYFLYSDRIHVNASAQDHVQIGRIQFPKPLTKTDKQGQNYTIYRGELNLPVPILGNNPGESLIQLQYQGCSDEGFCYPPEEKNIKVTINDQLALSNITFEEDLVNPQPTSTTSKSDLTTVFSDHNLPMTLLIFFGLGLLLSFTPCILPMVPVLSGIIIGHGQSITTRKAFFLSLSYVLSMSATYALVGALVAQLGANLQISMQSPWAIGFFSLIFVLLALSMFGFYELRLPQAWQSKIAGSSRSQRGGHYLGAALMGCLSTLILSPCVTAPLIGVLTYIAQTGNVFLGTITLFVLSLGMGTPLLLIGTSAGKWLPESGRWMNAIKAFFGILLIAVAIYLMERIIPAGIAMGLWGSLLIFSGIYSGALTPSVSPKDKFCQGIGIILLAYGLLILIGASIGSTNPLQPLANIEAATTNVSVPKKQSIKTVAQLEKTLKQAIGKPVLIDFYADWCASCKVMEATTLNNSEVKQALSHFRLIKLDVTQNNANSKALMNYFNVIAPPTFIFINEQGKHLKHLDLVGEASTKEFLQQLNQVKT